MTYKCNVLFVPGYLARARCASTTTSGPPCRRCRRMCARAPLPPPLPCKPSSYAHTHTLGGTRMPVHRRYRYPSPAIASVLLALLCVTRIIRSLGAARRVPGAADLDKSKIAVAEVSWRVPHPRRPVPEDSAVLKGCQSADDTLRKHR